MSVNAVVLNILRASDNPAADNALVDALGRVSPQDRQPLLEALLSRKNEDGLVGLVEQFHRLDEKLQGMILDYSPLLFPVLKRCVKHPNKQTRLNTIELVHRIGNCRLAYLLSSALHDSRAGVRQRAAEVLRLLGDRYFHQEKVTLEVLAKEYTSTVEQLSVQSYSLARLAEERSYLLSAVGEALTNYEVHYRPETAELGMWFAHHIDDRLWRAVSNGQTRCGQAVQNLLRSHKDPRIVPFLYEALICRDLRSAALQAVSGQRDDVVMIEFVRWAFLLADTRIRRALSGIHQLAWLERGAHPLLRLSPELYPRVVDLVLATNLPLEQKVGIFRDLLLRGPPEGRQEALWGLVAIDDEMSTQILRIVIQWDDPDLAGIALREVLRRHPEDLSSVMAEQVTSDSTAIREMASQHVSEYGFEQYWRNYDVLDEGDRHRIGSALLKTDPDFVVQIRRKLTASSAKDRLRALQIINVLEIAADLKQEIYRITHDSDGFVRSAAMTALGQLPGPTSERLLLDALTDPDDRVQANSIESLERLHAVNRMAQIRERLYSDDNRVKAHAVKAAIRFQAKEAMSILAEMLEHPEPAHRASGLWVVESLELMSLSAQIIRMARNDPDPQVRRRALRAIGTLQGAFRSDAPVPTPAPAGAKEVAP